MKVSSSPSGPPVVLRDGTHVELHVMRPGDAGDLVRFHHSLSPETTYLRFFSVHPELSDGEVERFTHVDHHAREALVATVDDHIVAVARYDRGEDEAEAEAAFVVADAWQGEGLGRALLHRLAVRARAEGISRLTAQVLPHNHRMLSVFRHAGWPMRSVLRDGVVHVELDLTGADEPEPVA
jgi:GNAT superfamily N-acetyltransferase